MGLEKKVAEVHSNHNETCQAGTISVHSFSDLTYTSPVVFLYLLKECYVHGTLKATTKFRALQQLVHQILHNSPQPGPSTYVIQCLYVLPVFGLYSEGFSHLIVSALRRYLKVATTTADCLKAKDLAAQLFVDIVGGSICHDERIIIKILEVFDVRLTNIEGVICRLKAKNNCLLETAKTFVEQYIFGLIESQSYMMAVTLLEHFSIRQSGQSFLLKMLQSKQFRAAEKWATFMGKQMLCLLVQEYVDRNMLKYAYETIKKNDLRQDFPDVYHKCKESALKMLAEKALWDIAEAKANGDRQLIEYLVYLAMEAGYSEKVDELCDRYSLEGFFTVKEPGANLVDSRYLRLNELVVEDIVWVDEVDSLCEATCHIEGCKVVGIDCEWKPNYLKGSKPNKVSIMQIATDMMVFIFDLIKLFEEIPDILDNCFTRIFQSPRILKLGYNFQCDIKQLAHSYGELECFKHYEMLLDIQNVFKEPRGGLSGLVKKILGAGLNKTRRNSNWEQRPLSWNQLEYAALDAAVLIHIFRHVGNCQPASVSEGQEKIEWKSYLVSHLDPKKSKKESKSWEDFEVPRALAIK
ncbi:DNA_pol_A_exo1 domain-containing protein [Cephalotus follicularis]|uniref:DNA_pol_A_exo1 domain-containing protein n=1 Tax=Cephalotus follicularis TaxID=3775 RepID=A0A1Q3BEM0_CEPFO|nr:DNA_pol_A_exo1 domain-containing protein [Cephalotus follicularis]